MPLTRKTRVSGSSIVVTIPSQLTEAYDIHTGDDNGKTTYGSVINFACIVFYS